MADPPGYGGGPGAAAIRLPSAGPRDGARGLPRPEPAARRRPGPPGPAQARRRAGRLLAAGLLLALLGSACTNNPYRPADAEKNYFYSNFGEPHKHLDPAVAYSAGEYDFMMQIYEPPLQYHYLLRPYQLVALTAEEVPAPRYYDAEGRRLGGDPESHEVARAVYTVRIRKGILYQDHPCFARNAAGGYLYHDLTPDQARGIEAIQDFPETGTRELTAADFVYQIKRLALPTLDCPILSLMAGYLPGLGKLAEELRAELDRIRALRREETGALYNQESDERARPIHLDLDAFPVAGLRVLDRYTYEVELDRKYPQFVYWLAMPFFAPVPWEAVRFYEQPALVDLNLTLNNSPVGTGAFSMDTYLPNREIVLARNERFRGETYPSEGEPGDRALGLLEDAGKPLPFLEKAIYKRENEAIPRWNKFLQGYYDTSGILNEVFDQAVQITTEGALGLTDKMADRGVQFLQAAMPSTYYFAFNMLDDQVGGYDARARKLRQAISIAVDIEEWIQIFDNGRGVPAQSLLPPGIYGCRTGREGMNPYVYSWDAEDKTPVRRPLEDAARLLAEAGYPQGRRPDGTPLVLTFDTYWTGAWAKPRIDWLRKQFARLNIDLQVNQTDYNRFQDKVQKGNYQILFWGWNADYPDPENFLFLLYGPNSTTRYGGANYANYNNRQFNRLFERMESMSNGPKRLRTIERMLSIADRDAPFIWGYHPVAFGLYHRWYHNAKPMTLGGNTLKYIRVDPGLREELRRAWNRPIVWPVAVFFGLLLLAAAPAAYSTWARQRRGAQP